MSKFIREGINLRLAQYGYINIYFQIVFLP